jgi:uncharacterized phage-associated protein
MPNLRFQFNETKGLEALTYIAAQWPDVTVFFASKVLFFAEKYHLNRYARPIVADTFIAMPNGPVPTTLYDFIKGRFGMAGNPAEIQAALNVTDYPRVRARREPNRDVFSPSDIECLDEAIAFCRARGFSTLSQLTHQERAWSEAPQNGPMDYAALIDAENPNAADVLAEAQEFAAFGVL